MFLDVVFHQIRVCSRDQDFSLIKICFGVSDYHAAFQRIQDVRIFCARFGNDAAVI